VAGAGDTLVGAGSARGLSCPTHSEPPPEDVVKSSSDAENFMTKQIEIHGRRVQLYSLDEGRTWASSPQSIVAYGQRKTMLRLELQKSFERIDGMPDPTSAISRLGRSLSNVGHLARG